MTQLHITDLDFDPETYVTEHFVTAIAQDMGYSFDEERISRIAAECRKLRKQGHPGKVCLLCAFEIDILLYGDPLAPPMEIRGIPAIHSILRELYEDGKEKQ